jgi:hypothetical protein
VDDTSETSLYLTNDAVANAIHAAYSAGVVTVSGAATTFPRPTAGPEILFSDGSPEAAIFAPQGSLYLRRDATDPTSSLYFKTTGCELNTGWMIVGAPPSPPGPQYVQLDFDNQSTGIPSPPLATAVGGTLSVDTVTPVGAAQGGFQFRDENDNISGPAIALMGISAIGGFSFETAGGGALAGFTVEVKKAVTLESLEENIAILANSSGKVVDIEADHNINLYCQSGPILIQGTGPSSVNDIRMVGLPTSNPGGSGKLWNNGGVINIT